MGGIWGLTTSNFLLGAITHSYEGHYHLSLTCKFYCLPLASSRQSCPHCPTCLAPTLERLRAPQSQHAPNQTDDLLPIRFFSKITLLIHAWDVLYTQNTARNLEISRNPSALVPHIPFDTSPALVLKAQ